MNLTPVTHHQLNRAYVQSKVIEANLQHIGDILSSGDGHLSEDLRLLTQRFGAFVVELSEASDTAAVHEEQR